ncbi:hypothetical protein STENM327S_01120 [Streptomyces tendae]
MSFGQGGPQSQWDPWTPQSRRPQSQQSQQPWNSGNSDDTPDWAALAEGPSEARAKRRRLFLIGGGALATVAIASAVAVAVVSATRLGPRRPTAPPRSSRRRRTYPARRPPSLPSPRPVPRRRWTRRTSSPASRRTRPRSSPDLLFPGTQLTMGDTVYKKGPTADTRTCGSAAQGTLPKVLDTNECTRLIRVTYTQGDTAVTVGVAVFRHRGAGGEGEEGRRQEEHRPLPVRRRRQVLLHRRRLPLHNQLLRPVRVLHRRRLHQRQGRHGEVHRRVPGR